MKEVRDDVEVNGCGYAPREFFFHFFFGCTHDKWKSHNYGTARLLTHTSGPGIEPLLPHRKLWVLNLVYHSGNSLPPIF